MSDEEKLRYGMNCAGRSGYAEECTCGLAWRA